MVSHDLQSIASLCNRVILLDHGHIRQIGPAAQVIATYEQQAHASELKAA
jgi:ABC-type polysaccharide/polyol phosphate transport system ATPase subunit